MINKEIKTILSIVTILIIGLFIWRQPSTVESQSRNEVVIAQTTAFNELSTSQFTPQTGWSFQYNINPRIVITSAVAGTVTMANSMATLSTGADTNQSATMYTIKKLRYLPGYGGLARFTAIFNDCTAGSEQLIGIGNANDGFFFGCNGATFGVMRRANGVDTWTAKSAWTEALGSQLDENLDITKGNVYQIQFQWLGYGEIRFFVENPSSGKFELAHRIFYANQNTTPSILQPQLPLYAEVSNSTNNTDIVLQTPSGIAGVEGKLDNAPYPLTLGSSAVTSKTVTTLANIITISNTQTFQG